MVFAIFCSDSVVQLQQLQHFVLQHLCSDALFSLCYTAAASQETGDTDDCGQLCLTLQLLLSHFSCLELPSLF